MSEKVIEVRDVCFTYGEQEVLHNVSFSVDKHAFVAIVGPNGGGKTTLLKLLLGELTPTFGSITVAGVQPAAARGKIGYVPQSFPFDSRFPIGVGEVVRMGRQHLSRFGFYRRDDYRAADEALNRVGLEGFAERSFAELSGGERQRVLIAQALAGGCEILMMDEPTANVDPAHAAGLYGLFSSLREKVTIMMVSHHLSVVTKSVTNVLCVNHSADLHTIDELNGGTVGSPADGMALLRHGTACHVLDASADWNSPHAACTHKKQQEIEK